MLAAAAGTTKGLANHDDPVAVEAIGLPLTCWALLRGPRCEWLDLLDP